MSKIEIFILIIMMSCFALMLGGMIATPDNKSVIDLISSEQNNFPEATNYVVDTSGKLKQSTIDYLNNDLKNFDGIAQIAVAVVNSTSPLTIEEYGIKLAEKWKVGYQGKDNGAIIILAIQDRKVRIEVGKGLEGDIPDAVAGRIIDESMIPSLKNSDLDAAIVNGVEAIKIRLTK